MQVTDKPQTIPAISSTLQLLSDSTQMSQTPKSHKIFQITQQSEEYNITNSYLPVLIDKLRTKTDKDDFFCLAAIYQFSHRKFA